MPETFGDTSNYINSAVGCISKRFWHTISIFLLRGNILHAASNKKDFMKCMQVRHKNVSSYHFAKSKYGRSLLSFIKHTSS